MSNINRAVCMAPHANHTVAYFVLLDRVDIISVSVWTQGQEIRILPSENMSDMCVSSDIPVGHIKDHGLMTYDMRCSETLYQFLFVSHSIKQATSSIASIVCANAKESNLQKVARTPLNIVSNGAPASVLLDLTLHWRSRRVLVQLLAFPNQTAECSRHIRIPAINTIYCQTLPCTIDNSECQKKEEFTEVS